MKRYPMALPSILLLAFMTSTVLAESSSCPKLSPEELAASNSAYVKIEAGGSPKNILKEESVGPFDLQAQRKRVSECGSGAAKCFKQFPETMKNGEMLVSYKFKDSPKGIPIVLNLEITSADFTHKDLLACLKGYWSAFLIPNVGAIRGHTGSATVSMSVQKIDLAKLKRGEEIFRLVDGTEIHGFQGKAPVASLRGCEKYATLRKGETYEFVGDGIKKVEGGSVILVSKGCIFPRAGTLSLNNGKFVDFYQEKAMNDDGELAFWSETMNPLPNGKYQTKKGTRFEIEDGHIQEYGAFENGDIVFEDHD
jgi:hypothetical protein